MQKVGYVSQEFRLFGQQSDDLIALVQGLNVSSGIEALPRLRGATQNLTRRHAPRVRHIERVRPAWPEHRGFPWVRVWVLAGQVADEPARLAEPMFMDRKTAAKTAGVSVDLIAQAIHMGTLRAKRSGKNEAGEPVGKYLISRDALRDWFDTLPDA
jgi:hypothetical protein